MTEQLIPVSIAVIDGSIRPAKLILYSVPNNWSPQEVSDWLESKGHRVNLSCWGIFDGNINDKRWTP